jgi:hypothetical protein
MLREVEKTKATIFSRKKAQRAPEVKNSILRLLCLFAAKSQTLLPEDDLETKSPFRNFRSGAGFICHKAIA